MDSSVHFEYHGSANVSRNKSVIKKSQPRDPHRVILWQYSPIFFLRALTIAHYARSTGLSGQTVFGSESQLAIEVNRHFHYLDFRRILEDVEGLLPPFFYIDFQHQTDQQSTELFLSLMKRGKIRYF